MKKDNALRQAARWVAKTFGYKSETLFGKIVWRVFSVSGAIFTVFAAGLVVFIVWNLGSEAYDDYKTDRIAKRQNNDPTYLHPRGNKYVSPYIIYHDGYGLSYLYDVRIGRRTMTGIQWINRSSDGDSLTFFSDGEKRGYFNRFTGQLAIPAQYDKAWVFAEGVACVMKQSQIQVIDHSGKALSQSFAYTPRIDDYCFHNGLCAMMGDNERIGLIDKQGQWVVEPSYKELNYKEPGFWLVYDSVWTQGLLFADGHQFLPCVYKNIAIDGNIFVTGMDHLDQVYDFKGNLVNVCNYNEIELMSFEGDEFVYNSYYEGYERKTEPANLRRYMSSDYHYGLIDKDGNVITPPSYSSIRAIAVNRYYCDGPQGAVILDDKGREH